MIFFQNKRKENARKSHIALQGLIAFFVPFIYLSASAATAKTYFESSSLAINGQVPKDVDLSYFEEGGQIPGTYRVKIYINNVFYSEEDVVFIDRNKRIVPSFTKEKYKSLGIVLNGVSDENNQQVVGDIAEEITGANFNLNLNKSRLDFTIPQAYVTFAPDDLASQELWDDGVNALFSSYDINYTQEKRDEGDSDYLYASLDSGLNVNGWHIRNNSTYFKQTDDSQKWESLETYAQHDLKRFRSKFLIGQTYTSGNVFDSFGYTGIRFYNDENMYPDNQQGFSPTIKGQAYSQSTITVKQNGYVLKEISVPAGAFSISDLNTVSNGNLEITIKESSGAERIYIQPWTNIPGMLREGRVSYAVDMGEYRSNSTVNKKEKFIQSQVHYGLDGRATIYGGAQLSGAYNSFQFGLAYNLGYLGALSVDATKASADFSHYYNIEKSNGEAYRIQYSKLFEDTNTTISVAGYRFATKGYYDFSEFNEYDPNNIYSLANKKSRVQILVYQPINEYGSLSFNLYRQDYWRMDQPENTYSFGYSFNIWRSNFNVNYINSKHKNSDDNEQISLNVTVPFSAFSNQNWVSYNVLNNKDNRTNSVSLFGSLDKERRWSYNLHNSYADNDRNNSISLSTAYKANVGQFGYSYSNDKYMSQNNYTARGSILVHPYGITLGNAINDAAVLIRAPGARNVSITGNRTISTDYFGYAILPNTSVYRRNRIGIDTATIPDNLDIEGDVKTIVPTTGSITVADFKTVKGYQALITLYHDGIKLPFGTPISLDGNNSVSGIIDDSNKVYMNGLPESGKLIAKWGNGIDEQCQAHFKIIDFESIDRLTVKCN